jgi:starch phosphorylase
LRLAQQYSFVSCSLQDMPRLLALRGEPIGRLADVFTAQLNDTHPSIAVAELMRLLGDERHVPGDQAWEITRRAIGEFYEQIWWIRPVKITLEPRV